MPETGLTHNEAPETRYDDLKVEAHWYFKPGGSGYRIIKKFVFYHDAAEEVARNCVVKFLKRLESKDFKADFGNLKGYLATIARSEAINYTKKDLPKHRLENHSLVVVGADGDEKLEPIDPPDPLPNPEERLLEKHKPQQIQKCFEAMQNQEYAELLRVRYAFEGKDEKFLEEKFCKERGIATIPALKSRLQKARKQFKETAQKLRLDFF